LALFVIAETAKNIVSKDTDGYVVCIDLITTVLGKHMLPLWDVGAFRLGTSKTISKTRDLQRG
jgi:hypothetical protein